MGLSGTFHEIESFDGTRIAWASWGHGPTVILANGIACSDTYWTYLVPDLVRSGFEVLFFDYRGHGRSGPPANPNEILVTAHARDLWAVADAAGVKNGLVVGHSMGVETALEAYRHAPTRVAGIVAIAGTYQHPLNTLYSTAAGTWLLAALELAAEPIPWLTRIAWRVVGANTTAPLVAGRLARMIGPDADSDLMHEYFRNVAAIDPLLLLRMFRGLQLHTARDLLPDIEVPVMILAGARDVLTPPRLARAMAMQLADVRLEVLPTGTHTLPIDSPGDVNGLVADFAHSTLVPGTAPHRVPT